MGNDIKKRIITIGNRLKQARESLGYTQEDVAAKLDIGRPRYSDIENGKRNVALKELYKFCDFFGRSLDYFLKETSIIENGFKVLFRKTDGNQEVAKIIMEFESLCERMYELEEINEVKIRSSVQKDYNYDKSKLWFWIKHYAEQERKILDLGQTPIRNLDKILEEKRDLKIFYLPIPKEKGIFGMFTFDDNMGGCILVNANPPAGNQLFSLAHEYGHFIFHKERIGIISFENEENNIDEKHANYFASEFLMPESAINDIFTMKIKNKNEVAAEDIIYIADYFGVSFQAMVYRLNNLRLLNDIRKEELINETWVTAVRKSIGISEPDRGKSKFPSLYIHLAIKAYQQNRITTSKLADFLELPLYQAMELGKKIKRSKQDESDNNI